MISLASHRIALRDNVDVARRLIDETHPSGAAGPISREARGLAIVLLFAAYENLLTSLTRTLLETALTLRVSNKRLQPGFRALAMTATARSTRDLSEKKLYSHALPNLVAAADPGGRVCTLNPDVFPADGSFMKRSQIELWCTLFGIGDPRPILVRTWSSVDAIVVQRNGIAHGRLTPSSVGRAYTEGEIRSLVADWEDDWCDFLDLVENRAQHRDFFRTP